MKGLDKGMAVIKNTNAEEGKHIYLCLCLKERPNFIISIFYAAMKTNPFVYMKSALWIIKKELQVRKYQVLIVQLSLLQIK